jgi:hypothetical protein
MITTYTNRRERRSNECGTALRFQLESTLKSASLEALTLSDSEGLLIACAGEDDLCEELGAVAPIIAHCAPGKLIVSGVGSHLDEVAVRAIDYFGQSLYLASLGGGSNIHRALARSAEGIQRILTAN